MRTFPLSLLFSLQSILTKRKQLLTLRIPPTPALSPVPPTAMAQFSENGLIVAVIDCKPGKGQGVS
jgi:hypothetical protein